MTFKELAEKQKKILENQPAVTLEQAKEQVKRLSMGKIDKKKQKLRERLEKLEEEMRLNLKQKTSDTNEISLGDYFDKISKLKKEIAKTEK